MHVVPARNLVILSWSLTGIVIPLSLTVLAKQWQRRHDSLLNITLQGLAPALLLGFTICWQLSAAVAYEKFLTLVVKDMHNFYTDNMELMIHRRGCFIPGRLNIALSTLRWFVIYAVKADLLTRHLPFFRRSRKCFITWTIACTYSGVVFLATFVVQISSGVNHVRIFESAGCAITSKKVCPPPSEFAIHASYMSTALDVTGSGILMAMSVFKLRNELPQANWVQTNIIRLHYMLILANMVVDIFRVASYRLGIKLVGLEMICWILVPTETVCICALSNLQDILICRKSRAETSVTKGSEDYPNDSPVVELGVCESSLHELPPQSPQELLGHGIAGLPVPAAELSAMR